MAEELAHFDGVALAVSSNALAIGSVRETPLMQSIQKSYNPSRSGDIFMVFEPNRIESF